MKKSSKALLCSALVIPGAGHIVLKKYLVGLSLMSISLLAVYILLADAMEKATAIAEKITSGAVPLNVPALMKLIENQASSYDPLWLDAAIWTVIICWIIGIADSYRIGMLLEKQPPAPPTPPASTDK